MKTPKLYMRNSIFLICLLLVACSKKNDNMQNTNAAPNTVSISGTTYSTVVIGPQTWTAVNYNGSGGENYNNGANNVTYGGLYTEAEAQAIALPAGWRLPAQADLDNLFLAIGAQELGNGGFNFPLNCQFKLMSTDNWTGQAGTNDLNFNAEPAGCFSGGSFKGLGTEAIFLSSTIDSTPVVMLVSPGEVTSSSLILIYATDRGSVRFVKDN